MSFLLSSGVFEPAIPDSGITRWEFEQNTDDSWGSNDGTDNTSAGYVTGQVGSYAKDLDGNDDNVTSDGVSLPVGSSATITAWVNPETSNQTDFAKPICIEEGNSGTPSLWIGTGSNDSWNFGVSNESDSQDILASGVSLTTDWTFLAATYDGSDLVGYTAPADGSLTQHGPLNYGNDMSDVNTISVGAQVLRNQQHFDGAVDDARFFSDARTQTEIQDYFDSTK